MILSNDGFVAFHYRSYGTFFLHQNKLHNIHRGFTHYKYYRATKTRGIYQLGDSSRFLLLNIEGNRRFFDKKML